MSRFEDAFERVQKLVGEFEANEQYYLSANYQESEVRTDYIDKFWVALGWDVRHKYQTNPREQEVKVERNPDANATGRRADYAFYHKPDYRNPVFFVEAKKPSVKLHGPKGYHQILKYGKNAGTPIGVLMDFEEFHIVDCRYLLTEAECYPLAKIRSYQYKDFLDREKFGEIYWTFSHEALEEGKLKAFTSSLPKLKGKGKVKIQAEAEKPIDEAFLATLEEYRLTLAKAFKKADESLTAEELTEATQKVIDRLVFIRFLEDKNIEADYIVDQIAAKKGGAWNSFISWSKELDVKYNGIVFKPNTIDSPSFKAPDDEVFRKLCEDISHQHSPYLFSYIPIEILGSIYERFLGKVVTATAKRADIEEKPEVRKAGGVYYTPKYIVEYIVANTVGKILGGGSEGVIARSGFSPTKQSKNPTTADTSEAFEIASSPSAPRNDNAGAGLTPQDVSKLRFADIACGSGSFLIAVYDAVLHHVEAYFNAHPDEARKAKCVEIDKDVFALSLAQKRQILLDNIYGVDIDNQAVEVAQLSLFLKLLESESGSLAGQLTFERTKILPDLSKNILCGNSLVEYDIEQLFPLSPEDEKRIKPFDYRSSFKDIMAKGGFDAIVGNPPYVLTEDEAIKVYLNKKFKTTSGKPDLYRVFVEKSNLLLKKNGRFGYIIPNSILAIPSAKDLRKSLLLEWGLNEIVDFWGEVFKGVSVNNILIFTQRTDSNDQVKIIQDQSLKPSGETLSNSISTARYASVAVFKDHPDFVMNLNPELEELTKKVYSVSDELGTVSKYTLGMQVYHNTMHTKAQIENRVFHSTTAKDKTYIHESGGRNISRYSFSEEFKEYVSYGEWCYNKPNWEFCTQERILIREIPADKTLVCCKTDTAHVPNKAVIILISDKYNVNYLLGILNSKLIGFYTKNTGEKGVQRLFPRISLTSVRTLPIKTLDLTKASERKQHDQMVTLVEQMLDAKKRLASARTESEKTQIERKCEYLDGEIDNLVYQLYGLTEEEIKIVDN